MTQNTNTTVQTSLLDTIVYKELNVVPGMSENKATALVQFLWYVIHDGQNLSTDLSYATLPANVVQIDETTINSMTFNGQHLSTI
jgi:hypothetical protein